VTALLAGRINVAPAPSRAARVGKSARPARGCGAAWWRSARRRPS